LGIAAPEPLYVISTDASTRKVTVGRGDELSRSVARVNDVNWISLAPPDAPIRAEVKIRNKHSAAPATIIPETDATRVEIRFDDPQRAVTPGQAAVFYSGDLVLGGGWLA
jgi:tRNA-specific 2-thiouridylase